MTTELLEGVYDEERQVEYRRLPADADQSVEVCTIGESAVAEVEDPAARYQLEVALDYNNSDNRKWRRQVILNPDDSHHVTYNLPNPDFDRSKRRRAEHKISSWGDLWQRIKQASRLD